MHFSSPPSNHTSSSLLPRLLYPKNVCINQLLRAGIAQSVCDSLGDGRSGNRISVGARFSALVQTGRRAHPASYTVGTGSFPGVKQSGRGIDHPPPTSADVKERVELYFYSSSGPSYLVLG